MQNEIPDLFFTHLGREKVRKKKGWLYVLSSSIFENTGEIIPQCDILRAFISAIEESGIDLSHAKSKEEISNIIVNRLKSYWD